MSRFVFKDFDEFADSIDGIAGRFVPTARSLSDWWLEAAQVGRLSLQQLQIGGAATFAGDGQPGTITLGLPMTDPQRMRIDGHALDERSFIYLKHEQPFTFAGVDVARWAGVTMPIDQSVISQGLIDTMHLNTGARTYTDLPHLTRLRALIARVCSGEATVSFADPVATSAAEQEISIVVARALENSSKADERHIGRPQFSRARVIARALALIQANEGQPLFIDDLCRATQVSERTLRNIFQEYFGVGPMRLLKVRQLREIRAALVEADPLRDTVTRVAARFGVWDFSLFARNYKALYGEAPSETLRRPAASVESRSGLTWMRYAGRIFIDDVPRGDDEQDQVLNTG